MTDNIFAPQETNKRKYGLLQVHGQSVVFEKGTSYSVPGVPDKDGNLRVFSGKRLPKDGEKAHATHVVMLLVSNAKDGAEYTMVNHLTSKDKEYKGIVYKALSLHFGADLAGITSQKKYVAIEEVPTGRTWTNDAGEVKDNYCWKLVEVFADKAAMEKAREAHFGRSSNGTAAHTATIPTPDHVGKARQMLAIVGGDQAKAKEMLAGMPEFAGLDLENVLRQV